MGESAILAEAMALHAARQIFDRKGPAFAALQAVIFLDGNKHEPFAPILGDNYRLGESLVLVEPQIPLKLGRGDFTPCNTKPS